MYRLVSGAYVDRGMKRGLKVEKDQSLLPMSEIFVSLIQCKQRKEKREEESQQTVLLSVESEKSVEDVEQLGVVVKIKNMKHTSQKSIGTKFQMAVKIGVVEK